MGFAVHELEPASTCTAVIGLEISDGLVRVKRARLWKLRRAMGCVLSRDCCSGALLEVLLGHATRLMLLRRESLSILHACYHFIQTCYHRPTPLWSCVRKELSQIGALLPLLVADTRSPWYGEVFVSDASPTGLGVCSRPLDPSATRQHGRLSEKWRFRAENAVAARAHAFSSPESVPLPAADIIDSLGTS